MNDTIELLNLKSGQSYDAIAIKMTRAHHCAHSLLPPVKSGAHNLRPKGHTYKLPRCDTEMYKNSFVPRCLYRYVYFSHCICVFIFIFYFISIVYYVIGYINCLHVRLLRVY